MKISQKTEHIIIGGLTALLIVVAILERNGWEAVAWLYGGFWYTIACIERYLGRR